MATGVEIGFSEACEQWEVESRLFPSKIGGKPAWLNLEKLPSVTDLQCDTCKDQMIFLCQVYAPYEDEDANFHRTIFIFICTKVGCNQRNANTNLKAFRSSLSKINKFYPEEPPEEKPDLNFSLSKFVVLCNLCGCSADKRCGKCGKAAYCCREHQMLDWKENHKHNCNINPKIFSSKLFAEFLITTEAEEIEVEQIDETKEMEKFEKLMIEGKLGTMQDISEAELEEHASVNKDKVFTQFQKRVNHFPDQILRYERNGEPLWIADEPKPKSIPNCEYCGGMRQFEFQIMPQLLSTLKEHELDWGTIAVYTCINSCTLDSSYKREFIFKQDCADINIS